MPIPTLQDRQLAEIDDLANVVMIRLRNYLHGGPTRDPAPIRSALQVYADTVAAFIDGIDER
ncbi:hypothetical protein ACQR1W_01910 [Bradyrhizobium sp. HKCCYLS1011]|uniref:hypothetical protein n=1 Tax=Bradyrhizobium sp. HKCCYLS1011 TaxID=3420733 RepID=UPI003EB966F4